MVRYDIWFLEGKCSKQTFIKRHADTKTQTNESIHVHSITVKQRNTLPTLKKNKHRTFKKTAVRGAHIDTKQ